MLRKFLGCILSFIICFCPSCVKKKGQTGVESNQTESENLAESGEALMTVEEIISSMKSGDEVCNAYDMNKYLLPIWESQIVYNETVMFIRDENGNLHDKKLTYPIAKILEVRSADLKTVYTEGVDYAVTDDGNFRFLEGGKMPVTEFSDNYTDKDNGVGVTSGKYPDKYLDYGEGVHFYYRQVCVSYIRTEKYDGPIIEKSDALSKTLQKLSNNEPLNVVFYGASITEGCNASGFANKAPFMPTWPQMVVDKLSDYYNNDKITFKNTAVGGWTTEQGWEEFNARVLAHNPDLLFLDFGGNDCTWSFTTERFGMKLCQMINTARKRNPNVEIVLLTPLINNVDAISDVTGSYRKNQEDFTQTIIDISTAYENVAVSNLTDINKWLLERKDFEDMTGNNISHPTDFHIRVIAQVILANFI